MEFPKAQNDQQIFANFDVFAGHVDMSNPTVKKLLFNWINFEKYVTQKKHMRLREKPCVFNAT